MDISIPTATLEQHSYLFEPELQHHNNVDGQVDTIDGQVDTIDVKLMQAS